ncbi:hypothetical protein CDAR_421851 [Caerostris darwini]|uniref:Uncharacterized protein n=1 Tax=Caerostris darwini TaxID=1538125 RepID=A0AAV4VBK0_9ARAC|nr:hypothetical protein CDAR_421851 [Caerostris darwini]
MCETHSPYPSAAGLGNFSKPNIFDPKEVKGWKRGKKKIPQGSLLGIPKTTGKDSTAVCRFLYHIFIDSHCPGTNQRSPIKTTTCTRDVLMKKNDGLMRKR